MSSINRATRRQILAGGIGLVGVGSAMPNYMMRSALADPKPTEGGRVVVVLQLSGGHDAMSELVPHGVPEYHKLRTTTRITEKQVIKINDQLGLHPNLKGFKQLLDEGAFAAIPGVGYPNPNYSHFTATNIWQVADRRGRQIPHGWIGRACDHAFKGNRDPKMTIAVGTGKAPLAIKGGEHPGLSFNNPESWRYTGDRGNKTRLAAYRQLNKMRLDKAKGDLAFVTQTAVNANESSDQIREMAKAYKSKVEYPSTTLSRNLRVIASLVDAQTG